MTFDMNKAAALLHIADKAVQWPNLKGLHDRAMDELQELSKDAGEELADKRVRAKAKAEEEAAKLAAEAAAEAEKQAAKEAQQAEFAKTQKSESLTTSDAARRL